MANTAQISGRYFEFIATEVVNEFGGSYQNYQTAGKIWRQQFSYNKETEDFIMAKTRLFLRTQDIRDLGNFNMMYKVCYNISEHLSKYLVKKSPDLSQAAVTDHVLNEIFFDSDTFVRRFKKAYKKPIDTTNVKWAQCNPGIVAMYKAINRQTAVK